MNTHGVVAALCCALTACGCSDPLAATEHRYAGSQIAVDACIKRNTEKFKETWRVQLVKRACIIKHQSEIDPRLLTGIMRLNYNSWNGTAFVDPQFTVKIKNTSADKIVTGVTVTITVERSGGGPNVTFTCAVEGPQLWITPGDEMGDFYVHATPESTYKQVEDLLKANAKWSWYISKVTAVRFKLRS